LNDLAVTLGLEMRQRGANRNDGTVQVYFNRFHPLSPIYFLDRAERSVDARVVDKDVKSAEASNRLLHQVAHLRAVSDIGCVPTHGLAVACGHGKLFASAV
jgi:hypothetical protein